MTQGTKWYPRSCRLKAEAQGSLGLNLLEHRPVSCPGEAKGHPEDLTESIWPKEMLKIGQSSTGVVSKEMV